LATALPEDGTGGLQRNWSATDGFLGVRLGNDDTASITIIDTLTALAWLVPGRRVGVVPDGACSRGRVRCHASSNGSATHGTTAKTTMLAGSPPQSAWLPVSQNALAGAPGAITDVPLHG